MRDPNDIYEIVRHTLMGQLDPEPLAQVFTDQLLERHEDLTPEQIQSHLSGLLATVQYFVTSLTTLR